MASDGATHQTVPLTLSAGGNGNRTKAIAYLTDDVEANARVTRFKYDWRDRQVFVVDREEYSSKTLYVRRELDNMGRVTKSERYVFSLYGVLTDYDAT